MTIHARQVAFDQSPELDSGGREVLNQIRLAAMECRLARKPNPESICALRHKGEVLSAEAHLSALLRLLPVAMNRRVTFLRPGVEDRSFDEKWLLRLLHSVRTDDTDSLVFGLASRIPRHFHAPIQFLAKGCADIFSQPS
ncbi:MAG: hypothetical protein AAGF44_01005 [Pseudomonadota bacterium]